MNCVLLVLVFSLTSLASPTLSQSVPSSNTLLDAVSSSTNHNLTEPSSLSASAPIVAETPTRSTAPLQKAETASTSKERWSDFNFSAITAGALFTAIGLGCAVAPVFAFIALATGLSVPVYLSTIMSTACAISAGFGPVTILLAPCAIGISGLIYSLETRREWWPPLVGSAVGWIVGLVPVVGSGIAVAAVNPFNFKDISYPGGSTSALFQQAALGALAVLALSPLATLSALGGSIVADNLFQPATD